MSACFVSLLDTALALFESFLCERKSGFFLSGVFFDCFCIWGGPWDVLFPALNACSCERPAWSSNYTPFAYSVDPPPLCLVFMRVFVLLVSFCFCCSLTCFRESRLDSTRHTRRVSSCSYLEASRRKGHGKWKNRKGTKKIMKKILEKNRLLQWWAWDFDERIQGKRYSLRGKAKAKQANKTVEPISGIIRRPDREREKRGKGKNRRGNWGVKQAPLDCFFLPPACMYCLSMSIQYIHGLHFCGFSISHLIVIIVSGL